MSVPGERMTESTTTMTNLQEQELDETAELTPAELARVLPRVGARRWSQRIPALYPVAVRYHRARRRIEWMRSDTAFAQTRQSDDLPVRVKRHKSLLLRQLGETEMWMQHNKVTNLKLACAQVDGLIIRPGETFSFNKLVGNATRRKGYLKGMRLSNGQARPGIGGGICQLANLLHWMVLHSPLTVTQRSTHSFDPFPDNGRVLPWGVGCSIVYNYVDFQFRNDTDQTFQLKVGDLRARVRSLDQRGEGVARRTAVGERLAHHRRLGRLAGRGGIGPGRRGRDLRPLARIGAALHRAYVHAPLRGPGAREAETAGDEQGRPAPRSHCSLLPARPRRT